MSLRALEKENFKCKSYIEMAQKDIGGSMRWVKLEGGSRLMPLERKTTIKSLGMVMVEIGNRHVPSLRLPT